MCLIKAINMPFFVAVVHSLVVASYAPIMVPDSVSLTIALLLLFIKLDYVASLLVTVTVATFIAFVISHSDTFIVIEFGCLN